MQRLHRKQAKTMTIMHTGRLCYAVFISRKCGIHRISRHKKTDHKGSAEIAVTD
jgi:hypothetical protein